MGLDLPSKISGLAVDFTLPENLFHISRRIHYLSIGKDRTCLFTGHLFSNVI